MTINRIDMEDITARADELREERDDLQTAIDDAEETLNDAKAARLAAGTAEHDDAIADAAEALTDAMAALADWREENAEELEELEELLEELCGAGGGDHQWNGDWYPRELIDVDSFEEYAEELASECYDIPDTWPHRCIDWEQAAHELAQDYSMVSFRGSDYYWR